MKRTKIETETLSLVGIPCGLRSQFDVDVWFRWPRLLRWNQIQNIASKLCESSFIFSKSFEEKLFFSSWRHLFHQALCRGFVFFSRFLSKFKTKSSSHRKVRVSIYSKINCNKLYSFCYGGNVVSRRKKLDQFIGLKSWTIQNKHWWHFVKILSIYPYIHARKCG